MITAAAVLSFFPKILPYLKKYWKEIIVILSISWCLFCIKFHCHSDIEDHGHKPNDTIVRLIYPDTNKILQLHGYDTTIRYVHEQPKRRRFEPEAPTFHPDSDHSDSIAALWLVLQNLSSLVLECDSFYNDAIAIRGYADSLRNDSIEIGVKFEVEGRLRGEPKISYRYLAPSREITITVHEYPKRKMYIEAGVGPRLLWKDNVPDAIITKVGLGYVGKKNLGVGLNGQFTHKDYAVLLSGRWYFNVGK